jgi:non-homologous end joining protein Ku
MPNGVVSNAVIVPTSSGVGTVRVAAVPASAPEPAPEAPSSQDLRLNIVHDQASGLFVYKFVDPTTGKVIQQLPNEDIVKLREAAEYSAGKLISTKI